MKRMIACTAIVFALTLGLGPVVAQTTESGHAGHGSGSRHETTGASRHYMDAMDKMSADMETMQMTGRPGVDFALMMIPHHQSAIDMAKAYLDSGEDDVELMKLSREIVDAQEREIAFLTDWLARNRR